MTKDRKPFASPACSLDELQEQGVDPAYFGHLSRGEILDLLAMLRGAARRQIPGFDSRLQAAIRQRGGVPRKSPAVVTRKIAREQLRAALPRVGDDALHALLRDLLTALES